MNMLNTTTEHQPDTLSLLSSTPPVLERYELKYVIPWSLVEPIRRFVAPYCVLDNHSQEVDGHFYPVNSLYLDSPGFRFLKLRMWGADRRFNMRIRSYGDGRTGPYFAEIKYRTPTSINKYRTRVSLFEWPGFMGNPGTASREQPVTDARNRTLFLRLIESYAVEAKIFTCYKRLAFVSLIDSYARVTFDINLRYRLQTHLLSENPWSLEPDQNCINYDTHGTFGDEPWHGDNVILELKTAAGEVPLWMMELIRRFQLQRVGFSKYMNSSLLGYQDRGFNYMSSDRASPVACVT
jgi:hypothetical protein